MSLAHQVHPHRSHPAPGPPAEPQADQKPVGTRLNWLFSGVLLGAAGWLLVLAVIFAALGGWIVATALLAAFTLCLLTVWRAGRRLRTVSPLA